MEKAKKMKENIDKKLEKREKVNIKHDEFDSTKNFLSKAQVLVRLDINCWMN